MDFIKIILLLEPAGRSCKSVTLYILRERSTSDNTVTTFTIGICAVDEADSLRRLIGVINREEIPEGMEIRDIVIVVSGGFRSTENVALSEPSRYTKRVFVESLRKGKAEAINRIMASMEGSNLILINADAEPSSGAIGRLMEALLTSDFSIVCATPYPASAGKAGNFPVYSICRFMWALHNATMSVLGSRDHRIHLTDEMIAIGGSEIIALPEDIVNDGAYLSVRAQIAGKKITFAEDARVTVTPPASIRDFLRQRRRIIYGHMQIEKNLGILPATAEFTLLHRPFSAAVIWKEYIKKYPLESLALPAAIILELISMAAALKDIRKPHNPHRIWHRSMQVSWR